MPWKDRILDYVLIHSGAVISAVGVFIAGLILARWAGGLIGRFLESKGLEPPLRMLISRIVRIVVTVLGALVALQTCGVDLLPLIAGLSVIGVGIGLAMQGVLSNLVAGLTIIFTKPFRIGEYIEVAGVQGQVIDIELFATTLRHADLSRVVIPNRKIVGEILHNYGALRQLDISVGVSYGTDLNRAQSLLREILHGNPRILKDPAPNLGVTLLAESSIVIAVKPWVNLKDAGPASAEVTQAIAERFREGKIEIPFPQREIRLLNPTA